MLMLVLPLVIAAVVLVYNMARRGNQKAMHQARRWALARGWNFATDNLALDHRWNVGPWASGGSQHAYNISAGTFDNLPVATFRFRHTLGSGDSQRTVTYTCFTASLPANLPPVLLKPEGAFAGGRDLTFESPEFNGRWRVNSPAERFAHDLLHPRMMERLLAPDALHCSIAFGGSDLLVYVRGEFDEQYLDAWLRLLTDLVALVPRFVWRTLGADSPVITQDGPGVPVAEQEERIRAMLAAESAKE